MKFSDPNNEDETSPFWVDLHIHWTQTYMVWRLSVTDACVHFSLLTLPMHVWSQIFSQQGPISCLFHIVSRDSFMQTTQRCHVHDSVVRGQHQFSRRFAPRISLNMLKPPARFMSKFIQTPLVPLLSQPAWAKNSTSNADSWSKFRDSTLGQKLELLRAKVCFCSWTVSENRPSSAGHSWSRNNGLGICCRNSRGSDGVCIAAVGLQSNERSLQAPRKMVILEILGVFCTFQIETTSEQEEVSLWGKCWIRYAIQKQHRRDGQGSGSARRTSPGEWSQMESLHMYP